AHASQHMLFGWIDPFRPVVALTGASSTGTGTTGTTGTTTGTSGAPTGGTIVVTPPSPAAPPTTSPSPSASPAGSGSSNAGGRHVITLVGISGQPPSQKAKVKIDSTSYTVKPGHDIAL